MLDYLVKSKSVYSNIISYEISKPRGTDPLYDPGPRKFYGSISADPIE